LSVTGRSEVRGGPRSFFQVPGVDVAGRARQENENAVPGGAVQVGIDSGSALQQPGVQHRREVRRHDARTGNLQELPARETLSPDREGATALTFALLFHRGLN